MDCSGLQESPKLFALTLVLAYAMVFSVHYVEILCFYCNSRNRTPRIAAGTAILDVYRKFQNREITEMDPDSEFVLYEGEVHIGRYHPVSVADELALSANESDAAKVEIGVPGLLQTLKWVTDSGLPLNDDMVIIETKCVGLNLKARCLILYYRYHKILTFSLRMS
jgi:hypothetical protein